QENHLDGFWAMLPSSSELRGILTRPFLAILLLPALIIAVGTTGYVVIEGWTTFEALYMTVMTVTTVGFGEVHPLSERGKLFTIFLMLGGIFAMFYAAGEIIRAIVSGQLQ